MFHSREPGVSGNFRGRIKGAKYRFPLQDGTWDFPGDAVAGKGLMITTKEKPVVDTQNIKIKESKHAVISHQTTKEGSKRGSEE